MGGLGCWVATLSAVELLLDFAFGGWRLNLQDDDLFTVITY